MNLLLIQLFLVFVGGGYVDNAQPIAHKIDVTVKYENMSIIEAEESITNLLDEAINDMNDVTSFSSTTSGAEVTFSIYTNNNPDAVIEKLRHTTDILYENVDDIKSINVSQE